MTGRTNLEQGQSCTPQSEFVLLLNSDGEINFSFINPCGQQFLKFTSYKGNFHFDTHMDLQSSDTVLIKYPIQNMFEGRIFTIYPHFIPINLEPFAIFAANSNELMCQGVGRTYLTKGVIEIIFVVKFSQNFIWHEDDSNSTPPFDIYLPYFIRLQILSKLVWVAIVLSMPRQCEKPYYRIRQIQFPHLFYLWLTIGNKVGIVHNNMINFIFMLLIRVVVAAIITLCVALIASPILALIGSNELVKTLYVITFIIGLFINPNDFLSK